MDKLPIAVLIGNGSKLPAIIKASKSPKSTFFINLVVSHKKESSGLKKALNCKIPAIYFNLPDFRNRFSKSQEMAKQDYSKVLGWFISQNNYNPKLLVFAGWDLILGKSFFNYFKSKIGDGFAAINIHPAIMPLKNEGKLIKLPDGSKTAVIKGDQEVVLKSVLENRLTYFGPTVHFMNPSKFDTGTVIKRRFIRVGSAATITQLKKKLMPIEDKLLITSINKVCRTFKEKQF